MTEPSALVAPPLPASLPSRCETGSVVVVTGRRDQRRSRWVLTLSTAWTNPNACDRPVLAIAADAQFNLRACTQALMFALGKNPHVTGAWHKDEGNLDLPAVWLLARRTREIIVRDAQDATPSLLRTLVQLAVCVGARIWLIGHEHRGDELDAIAELWNARRVDLDEFDRWWDRPDGRPPRARRRPARPVRCDLPASSALTFRADCRRLLPADRFDAIDELYVSEFRGAYDDLEARRGGAGPLTHEAVLARLRERVRDLAEPWQAVVAVRAIEAAALWFGFNVIVDHHQLVNSAERNPRRGRHTAEDHGALDAYIQPNWAATAALIACEAAPADLAELTIGSVTEDAATVHLNDESLTVPVALRPYVDAQRLLRVFEGADAGDLLLVNRTGAPLGVKGVKRIVKITEVETGVRLARTRSDTKRMTAHQWATAHGVAVKALGNGMTRRERVP